MKHTVLTTAFLAVSALALAAPSPALAGSSLAGLIRSEVLSAVGAAKSAAAEAEMRQLRAKMAMAAKVKAAIEAKAAMEAEAAMANRSGAMQDLPGDCPPVSGGASVDQRPSLLDNDRCR